MSAPAAAPPSRCLRCWRPAALCYCRTLVPVRTRTHVVIFQHPRERIVRTGTARLAHLGLEGSELHVGVRFDEHPRLRALAAEPRGSVALLYPGDDGAPAAAPDPPPRTLVVVDGTWITARKMIARSRLLQGLPRVSLRPRAPSAYRIRREPAAHCLSTVEAVVAALGDLEGDAASFGSLLQAFDRLVELQVDCARTRHVPYRRERRRRRPRRASAVQALLAATFDRLVVAQAEGNPHDAGGPHELVQLLAERVATGERFATLVRPRYPLGPLTPARLGLAADALRAGASPETARTAWQNFLGPGDLLAGWGRFTPTMLGAAGLACPAWIDLRGETARRLGRRPGGADLACRDLAAPPAAAWAPGRAGERLAELARLARALAAVPIRENGE